MGVGSGDLIILLAALTVSSYTILLFPEEANIYDHCQHFLYYRTTELQNYRTAELQNTTELEAQLLVQYVPDIII